MDKGKVYSKNKDMVSREIDDEMILMPIYRTNKEISKMYTLNETARTMWEMIDGKSSLKRITDCLCGVYKAPRERIETDLGVLIKDLKEIKAIE